MTSNNTISFSESNEVALRFATRLLDGTLNFKGDEWGNAPVEQVVDNAVFSTVIMTELRVLLGEYYIKKIIPESVISIDKVTQGKVVHIECQCDEWSEITIHMHLSRTYYDGESAAGWGYWSVHHAELIAPAIGPVILRPYDGGAIWGTRK
jgi:hypothetical protein